MAGPRSSAQRPKPSKAAKANAKQFPSEDSEKSAYRAMKSAGAGGSFKSARDRIAARRLAKKSGKQTFKDKVAKGSQTYTGAPVIAGISADVIEERLEGTAAVEKRRAAKLAAAKGEDAKKAETVKTAA